MHDLYISEICWPGAIFSCWQYWSTFIQFCTASSRNKRYVVKWCITVVQDYLTLESAKAIIVPHWIIWCWHTGCWWVDSYIWYSEEGTGQGCSPPMPLLAVPNVTADPSTASVPINVLLYNSLLIFGFDVPIKGLRSPTESLYAICY